MRKLQEGMKSWRLHVYERNFSNDKCMHAGIVPLMIVMRKNAEKYEELQDTTAPS
jgi:hypothetical protein